VWGFPWVPAVFVIASLTIVVNRLISQPIDSAEGLAMIGIGVPAYYLWARRQ
jgi:basic amino acid/polyamine antiporter, APA family